MVEREEFEPSVKRWNATQIVPFQQAARVPDFSGRLLGTAIAVHQFSIFPTLAQGEMCPYNQHGAFVGPLIPPFVSRIRG